MTEPLEAQIQQLRTTIATLQAQRALLGDTVADGALAPLRAQLAELEARLQPSPAEERRLLTILFTDIVGSTSLAEKLDPEEWRQTVARVHSAAGNLIAAHGGKVAQYLGDGLLALFGSEQATEQDPEKAIRAALEIQRCAFEITDAPSAADIPSRVMLRIGIHTGLVVMGQLGAESHKEFTATGDAMNMAARLQSAAPPGSILISHDTYHYVRGVFDVTPQPPLMVKGKQEPLQTYLVRRAKPHAFRTSLRGVAGIQTRTIGRELEFKQLQNAYLDSYEHQKAVWVHLRGEAGIGKSRLVDDLRDWLELRPEMFRLLQARAFAGDEGQPFALIRRLWFDRFQIAEDAPLAQAEAKWVKGFRDLARMHEQEPAHALGLLLGLPFNESPFIGAMRHDPTQVRGRALVVSRELLRALRHEQPVVVLLEDLQWIDAASLEYLQEALLAGEEKTRETASNGLFILTTARPEWASPDTAHPPVAISLAPLSDRATRELASELLREVDGTPDLLVDLIVERSEGIPYYAEELVNWFLDRGILDAGSRPWRFFPQRLKESPLPATLQHLLLTRLSALSENERAALQRGSIFGRRFWSGGVEALGVRQSKQVLDPLQPRGLIDAQPESSFLGEKEWSFSQTLLREVTYESVLKRERGGLHRTAAEWLEAQAERSGRLDEFAGLIGEHCERAGELGPAADWYLRAGELALRSAALVQARRLFDRSLELLPPVDRERRWRGLTGREQVLDLQGEREGQKRDIDALLELAEAMDDDTRRAHALFKQTLFFVALGESAAVVTAADATIAAARRAGYPALEVKALAHRTAALSRLGDLDSARASAQETLGRAEAAGDREVLGFAFEKLALYYEELGDLSRAGELHSQAADIAGQAGDPLGRAVSTGNLAGVWIGLGLYKQARTTAEQALALSEAVASRRIRAYHLSILSDIHISLHDGRAARPLAEEVLSEAIAIGDAYLAGGTRFSLAYIAEQAEDYACAALLYEQIAEEAEHLGLVTVMPMISAGLARCALGQGRLEEARRLAIEIWGRLKEHADLDWDRFRNFQTVADIFEALGETEQALAVVEAGYQELLQKASKITNPEWRQSFMENVEPNRALVEMWERMSGARNIAATSESRGQEN